MPALPTPTATLRMDGRETPLFSAAQMEAFAIQWALDERGAYAARSVASARERHWRICDIVQARHMSDRAAAMVAQECAVAIRGDETI